MSIHLKNLSPTAFPGQLRGQASATGLRFGQQDDGKKDAASDAPSAKTEAPTHSPATSPTPTQAKAAQEVLLLTGPAVIAQATAQAAEPGSDTFTAVEEPPPETSAGKTEVASSATTDEQANTHPGEKPGFLSRFAFWRGNGFKISAGLFFKHILPIAMGFTFLTGPLAIVFAVAAIPLAYGSGLIGKKLLADSKPEEHPQSVLQAIRKLEAVIEDPKRIANGELSPVWNQMIDNFLDFFRLKKGGSAPQFVQRFFERFRLTETSALGKAFKRYSIWNANMFYGVAQADTVSGAIKAGAVSYKDRLLYATVFPTVGNWVKRIPGLKALGWLIENIGFLHFLKPLFFGTGETEEGKAAGGNSSGNGSGNGSMTPQTA